MIRIYDLGEAEGVKFITMEFVEGEDLRALILKKKKFAPEEAVEIIKQACHALEAAHSVGVIHRDLKPQNIMCDGSGRVLVMDFGLARTLGGDGMTQTGALVGTMEYMSPEQALAKELDQRSDLFTLGLILYEMLVGVTPFHAESAVASLIKRNSERAIPVSDQDGTIPRALSDIVSKCLERDPNLSYQNAAELLRDLEAWKDKERPHNLAFTPASSPGDAQFLALIAGHCDRSSARGRWVHASRPTFQSHPAQKLSCGSCDVACDFAFSQCLRRSESGLAGLQPCRHAKHRRWPVSTIANRQSRTICTRYSRIFAYLLRHRARPDNHPPGG